MRKPWRLLIIVLVIVGVLLFATPAYADMSDPDSPPTVDRIRIYHNLLETGDFLLVLEANIPYASTPGTPVTEAFIWRLIHTDGTTVFGTTTGYAYNDNGYGYNVYSMYLDAATFSGFGMVWGTAYTIRLTGNPAVFVTPPTYNFTISSSDYTTLTETADNQAALAAEILYLAGDLNVKWALPTDYRLTLESETGTVLSIYGEDVFRGSIYGVQALAPTAFRFVVENIGAADRSWNTTYVTSLENQWAGTWIETARNASRDLLGTDYDLMSIILLVVACGILVVINLSLTSDAWNGLIDVAFVLVVAARLGVYGLIFLALVAAMCIFYIATRVWRMIPT